MARPRNYEAVELFRRLSKANPNHDNAGRFASGAGAGGGSVHEHVASYLAKTPGAKKPTEAQVNVAAARIAEVIASARPERDPNRTPQNLTRVALGGGPGTSKPGQRPATRQEIEHHIAVTSKIIRTVGASPFMIRELADAHAQLLTLKD